jgi:phospholipase/carboxylesterase
MPDPNNDTSLISFNNWTLRVRETTNPSPRSQAPPAATHALAGSARVVPEAERSGRASLMLLIHGLTGDENSMWVFAQKLSSDYWMIAPRAPYPSQMEQGGYSWRPAQNEAEDHFSLEQLRESAEALIRLVDEYSASMKIDASVFDVIGFSQGAAMSSVLAFLYPQRIRKVGILAGFVPDGLEELVSQRPLDGKPFFVAHGTRDEMVTIERARSSIEILERAGAQVTFCEDQVGHKVSVNCLRALKSFLAETQSTPPSGSAE